MIEDPKLSQLSKKDWLQLKNLAFLRLLKKDSPVSFIDKNNNYTTVTKKDLNPFLHGKLFVGKKINDRKFNKFLIATWEIYIFLIVIGKRESNKQDNNFLHNSGCRSDIGFEI